MAPAFVTCDNCKKESSFDARSDATLASAEPTVNLSIINNSLAVWCMILTCTIPVIILIHFVERQNCLQICCIIIIIQLATFTTD